MKFFVFIVFMSLFGKVGFNQTIFYQDVFHGGVTGGGFSTGLGVGSGTVNLFTEPNSTIKKAFIFIYSTGENINDSILINGVYFKIESMNQVVHFTHKNTYFSPIYTHCINITDELNNSSTTSFLITIPIQPDLPFKGFFAPFIYIAYENLSLPIVNSNIILNTQRLMGNETYIINNLNPINTNEPVGFSIYTDRSAPYGEPNCNIYFNNNLLGIIGGSDNVNNTWGYAGVKGHFYYQNNQLFGLDDDTPDAVMNGTDGLADVSSYLSNNATSCNFQLTDINYPNQPVNATNVNLAYFLTYSSPCDTFSVSVPSDTTICYGEQLQLNVTGGQQYEWIASTPSNTPNNPVPGLSCSDCPNPIFTGNSSMVYTVRIWNNDSCSVVRPIRVNVSHPEPVKCYTGETKCGFENGYISINSSSNFSEGYFAVTPNGDTLSNFTNNHLGNLGAGDYSVYYIDTFGCKSEDTIVTIETYNNTAADFSVDPSFGTAPLEITIDNQSQNATHFEWFMNGESTGDNPINIFDSSGEYKIGLVAWEGDASCADTTWKTIFVFDSLVVTLPNVFTPNNDGVNDYFNVKTNLAVSYQLSVLNRWGNVVFEQEGELAKGIHNLWDGKTKNSEPVTDGTYFYTISFKLDSEEVDCEITDCELRKEGFVQVFGK